MWRRWLRVRTGGSSSTVSDEAGFAAALRELGESAELRTELAHANYARALAEYGEAEMLARYQQLYGATMRRADFARQD
jgi:glycosyltransferase involved in cell wall biosynthesis